ncbi:MAG: glycosyltransferase family 2 protein [Hydrogenophaga sp.]|nr:glycosyltransferase family 2 protein [Hydrogenophaga sp.]
MSNQKNIKLTIAIPTYNRCEYLAKLLAELSSLDLKNDSEILIVDNASTDETSSVLARYKNNPNFTILENNYNIGIEGNIIKALTNAAGEFVWLLSDHMQIHTIGANNLLNAIRNSSSIDIGYAQIESYGSVLEPSKPRELKSLSLAEKAKMIFCTSNISGLVVRSTLIQKSIRSIYRMSRYTYPHLGVYFHLNESDRIIEFQCCTAFQASNKTTYSKSYDTFVSRFIEYPKLLAELKLINPAFNINGLETKIKSYTAALHGELLNRLLKQDNIFSASDLCTALTLYSGVYKSIFLSAWILSFLPLSWRNKILHKMLKIFFPSKYKIFI